ncbi:hypothetical protein Enr17x_45350 [Gimesia fumaroli]|uniref:Uncharacterized protein n=1 Tax=Gimesia fumaroli TaxID=2527976 RepID=A0A518IHA0_9PLAN|nr:hypothetical protein Enr17x_45350 [Gimesia fumaroli]
MLGKNITDFLNEVSNVNTPPRKRRRRRPQEEPTEERYESPRRRKKKSSGNPKKKKSSKPNIPIGLIAGVAGTVVVVIAIMVVDWKSLGQSIGLSSTSESLTKRLLSYQEEQASILASIKTEADAQAAGPKLIQLNEDMARTSFEISELQEAENLPLSERMALKKEFGEKSKASAARMAEEIQRIAKNPQLASTVRVIMSESGAARSRVTNELRLNKAKEGVNDDGYSPVTSSTELTNGMRIEFIDPFNMWKKGMISDVRNDGKVKVGIAFEYLDRDRLRIPD